MFLTETWNDQNLDIPGFETINSIIVQPNQKLLARNRVVSALYSKANLKIMLPLLKIPKTFCGENLQGSTNTDLFICGTYMPPEKSNYFKTFKN